MSLEKTLHEVFDGIAGARGLAMTERVALYFTNIAGAQKYLKDWIESEKGDCLRRGTKTDGFDNHCRTIAQLQFLQAELITANEENKRLSRWPDYFAWEREFKKVEDENKRLREELSDKTERLQTIKELAGMYESLLGTNQEAPWVRSMMSIYGQAEQALNPTTEDKESDDE